MNNEIQITLPPLMEGQAGFQTLLALRGSDSVAVASSNHLASPNVAAQPSGILLAWALESRTKVSGAAIADRNAVSRVLGSQCRCERQDHHGGGRCFDPRPWSPATFAFAGSVIVNGYRPPTGLTHRNTRDLTETAAT